MALVVFLRGVNVGGHKSFQPTALAKQLVAFDVVNVGAAGTFVVRKAIGQAALRAEILRRLSVKAEFMICRAREVLDLASRARFSDDHSNKDIKRYVTVLASRPRSLPKLPIDQPDAKNWQVRVLEVIGRFVLSLHRRMARTLIYPNEVVEKKFAVSATTRNWNTIEAICKVIQNG